MTTMNASQTTVSNDFYEYDIMDTVNVKGIDKIYKKNTNSRHVNSEEVNNKCEKAINMRIRDSRYALKNRRSINKDWKDFNNSCTSY